ncbi:DUF2066 domain-containing protein [Roseospira navarrensis]|uniref:DUF2066 domain-containing protein n=1 Tax=Roseospira navarrensis TaxID=140058 RepID=A0A7X1ZG46_9PROT|nr:DUF2066 domain-containing protein [Roseospira navarrensis]MQX36767.1 DUF2066 domain-containing protein [Roseospira navarrensis]
MAASRTLKGWLGRLPGTIAKPGWDATAPAARARRPLALLRAGLVAGAAGIAAMAAAPLTGALVTAPAWAQAPAASAAYTARDVPIEATADNPAQAREQAVAAGQVSAFQHMLRGITDPADHGRLPQPPADQVRRMVETYSLSDERTTDTRYSARITVRYDGAAVRDLLQRQGIGHAANVSQPVVVVPVYQDGPNAAPVLWEDTNPWLTAWRTRDAGETVLMPMEVPTGDLRDVTSITAEEALAADSTALGRLLDRYGRDQALVTHAVRTGPDTVRVTISYGSPRAIARTAGTTVERLDGESDADFLARAARSVADRMDSDWRRATTVTGGTAREVTALASLSGFGDWVAIRRALDTAPLVRSYKVQAMTRDRAQLTLTVLGDAARVEAALAPHAISVSESGGYWILSRAPAPSASPAGGFQDPAQPGGPAAAQPDPWAQGGTSGGGSVQQ